MSGNRYDHASRDELIHAWDQLHGLHNTVLHELLLVTAATERKGIHTQDGQRSMRSWLQLHAGFKPTTARDVELAASKLEELPALASTFANGRISFDKLVTCAEFASPEDDERVAKEAEEGSLAVCAAESRRRREIDPSQVQHAHSRRSFRMTWTEDNTVLRLQGRLPAEEGATLKAAIARLADSYPLFAEDGTFPDRAQRQADALVDLARKSIAEDEDPDRATVVLSVDLETLTHECGIGEEVEGAVLSSDVMQRVVCDSRLQAIIRGPSGEALGVSSVLRTAPPHLRRVLDKRDRGCRFPGCTNTRFLDAHHLIEWTRGGKTELRNLALVCRAHHRLLHRRGWSMRGDPNGPLEVIDDKRRRVRAGPRGLEEDVQSWLWDDLLQGSLGTSADRKRVAALN